VGLELHQILDERAKSLPNRTASTPLIVRGGGIPWHGDLQGGVDFLVCPECASRTVSVSGSGTASISRPGIAGLPASTTNSPTPSLLRADEEVCPFWFLRESCSHHDDETNFFPNTHPFIFTV